MEKILHQLHYLQGFIHPRWFSRRISEPSTVSVRYTLPETKSLPLEMDGWKMTFLLGPGLISGAFAVGFRECIIFFLYCQPHRFRREGSLPSKDTQGGWLERRGSGSWELGFWFFQWLPKKLPCLKGVTFSKAHHLGAQKSR